MPQKWLLFPFSVLLLSTFPSRPCFCRLCFDFGQNIKERWEFALKSYAEVQPDFAEGKKQHANTKIQILERHNIEPQKFSTPSKVHSALYLSVFFHVLHTKNEHNISFYFYFQNVQKHAFTPHILNGNSMNCAAYCGHKESAASQVNFATQHLTMYLFSRGWMVNRLFYHLHSFAWFHLENQHTIVWHWASLTICRGMWGG